MLGDSSLLSFPGSVGKPGGKSGTDHSAVGRIGLQGELRESAALGIAPDAQVSVQTELALAKL